MSDGPPRYYSGSRAFHDRAVIAPGTATAVAVVNRAGDAYPTAGIAFPFRHLDADHEARRPAETAWRLIVRDVELPGTWVLRRGEFIRLD